MPDVTDPRVDAHGWDLVHALSLSCINAVIDKQPQRNPDGFDQSDPTNPDGDHISGAFGKWRFTPGGSEAEVRMSVPVATISGVSWGRPFSAKDILVTIGVKLEHLPDTADPDGIGRSPLVVSSQTVDGDPPVNVIGFDFGPDGSPGVMQAATIRGLLKVWLNRNVGQFSAILHLVKLDRQADDPANQWLQPAACKYAYCDRPDQRDGILAVLSVAQKGDEAGLISQISENALGPDHNMAYIVGAHQIMRRWILPRMPEIFQGTTSADFQLSPDGRMLGLARQAVSFSFKNGKGKTETGQLHHLELGFNIDSISIHSVSSIEVQDGLLEQFLGTSTTLYFDSVHKLSLQQNFSASGPGNQQPFSLSVSRSNLTCYTDQPDEVAIKEADWRVAFAAINLIGQVSGDIIIPAPLEAMFQFSSLLNTLIQVVSAHGQNQQSDFLANPSIDITAPFDLPSKSEFRLQNVSMNGSLVMRGVVALA